MLVRTSKSWADLRKIIDNVPRLVREQRSQFNKEIAQQYYSNVIRHMEIQDLPWKKLKPYYLEAKRKQGLDPRIWIATGLLKSTIEIIPIQDDDSATTYLVGISGDKTYPGGVSVALVGIVLEYGRLDKSIVARPLFRPSFHETRVQLREMAEKVNKKLYDKYIKAYLRR